MNMTLILLIYFFTVINFSLGEKTFRCVTIRAEDWTINEIADDAFRTASLCQTACVLKEANCTAYHFNVTAQICELGEITGTDVIYVKKEYGITVHVDVSISLPELAPHIFVIGSGTQYEFSLKTDDFVTNSAISTWTGAGGDTSNALGMVYDKKGIFVCGGNEDSRVCKYQAFFSETWETWPSMPTQRYGARNVVLGSKSMWVLGGRPKESYVQHLHSEIFTNGKWHKGPQMGLEHGRTNFGVVKVSHKEVLMFGGSIKSGVLTKTTYMYDFFAQTWTRKADMLKKAYKVAYHGLTQMTNGTRVVASLGGLLSSGTDNKLYIYNVGEDFWTEGPEPPIAQINMRPVATTGVLLYIFGRHTNKDIYVYNFDDETWTDSGKDITTLTSNSGVIVLNG